MRQLQYRCLQLSTLAVSLLPSWAQAALTGVKKPAAVEGQFSTALARIFTIIIIVAGVAFVGLFFVGGVMYLTSLGNEDGTKKARQLMLDAVIGLVIVVIAWSAAQWVLRLLGLQGLNFDS